MPLVMMCNFLTRSNTKKVETKLRKSIKWALGLKMNTPNDMLYKIIKLDFQEWSDIEAERALIRWKARLQNEEMEELPKYELKCYTELLPKEAALFINLQNAFCKQCKKIFSRDHYLAHGVQLPTIEEMIDLIKFKIRGTEIAFAIKTNLEEKQRLSALVIGGYTHDMQKELARKMLLENESRGCIEKKRK